MTLRSCWRRSTAVAAIVVGAWASGAAAHDLSLTEATLVVRPDRTWTLDLVVDLDALALGAGSEAPADLLAQRLLAMNEAELDAALARVEGTLSRRVRVLADGEVISGRLSLPGRGTGEARGEPTALGLLARYDGELGEQVETVSVRLSRGFPPMLLTVLDGVGLGAVREAVEHGGESTPWRVGTSTEAAESPPSWPQYLRLGILHIVPRGLDHVLFVLGLFLLAPRLAPLLWQVSAFTLAHTISLGLATTGVLSLPSRLVEAAIALSILWVGLEAVLRAWRGVAIQVGLMRRVVVVFCFGLLHGLGFAGVLGEIGLPDGELIEALVGFNVGVELGQLLVIAAAALLIGTWRDRPWYPRWLVVPLGLVIAAAGLFWTVERLVG